LSSSAHRADRPRADRPARYQCSFSSAQITSRWCGHCASRLARTADSPMTSLQCSAALRVYSVRLSASRRVLTSTNQWPSLCLRLRCVRHRGNFAAIVAHRSRDAGRLVTRRQRRTIHNEGSFILRCGERREN